MRAQTRVFLGLIFVVCTLPSAVSALELFGSDAVIWQDGPNQYVKLADQDGPEYGANEHPVTLNADALKTILESLVFDRDDARTVFTTEQADLLGKQLAEGLQRASTDQDLIFSLMRSEKSELLGFRADRFFVAGRAFYRLGQFHIIFGDYDRWRNDSAEKAYDPTDVGVVRYKLDHGKRSRSSANVKFPVMSLDGIKNMRYKGEIRNDWVVVDMDRAIASLAQADQVRRKQELLQKRKEILDALGEDAALIIPQAAPAPVPVQQPRSVEERLMTLKGLKDKGLITEEEYGAKRQQILNSL